MFVQDTRPSPEPAFVVARDLQLDDLVRFCTIQDGFTILTVDPTFNIGDHFNDLSELHHGLCGLGNGKSTVNL